MALGHVEENEFCPGGLCNPLGVGCEDADVVAKAIMNTSPGCPSVHPQRLFPRGGLCTNLVAKKPEYGLGKSDGSPMPSEVCSTPVVTSQVGALKRTGT